MLTIFSLSYINDFILKKRKKLMVVITGKYKKDQ